MSDRPRHPDREADERALVRLWSALERGEVPETQSEDEQAYVELAGLLPYALAPVEPRPGLLPELLHRVARREGAGPLGDVVPFVRGARDDEAPWGTQRGGVPRGVPRAHPAWRHRLGSLVAAALGAIALGLGGFSLWLVSQLNQQRQQIALLEAQMATAKVSLLQLREIERSREQLRIAVDPSVKVCALRPPKKGPSERSPRGLLYVQPDHKRWMLTAEKLQRCPQGRLYQVWFLTDGGAVHGGTCQIEEGHRMEIAADDMPEGTRAVEITLEFGAPAAPSGEVVLYGDDLHSLL